MRFESARRNIVLLETTANSSLSYTAIFASANQPNSSGEIHGAHKKLFSIQRYFAGSSGI
jgi:hypothetical protein